MKLPFQNYSEPETKDGKLVERLNYIDILLAQI